MNVFLRELKMCRSAFLLWTGTLVMVSLMYQSIYPSFAKDAKAAGEILAHLPAGAAQALNLDINIIFSFLGFYVVTLTLISLVSAFQGMGLGLTLFTREEQSKTTDFLISKPIHRSTLFFSKFLAGCVVLGATMTLFTLATFVMAKGFGAEEFSVKKYLLINLILFGVQLWFYVFGITLTQIWRITSVIGTTLAFVCAFFAVGVIGSLVNDDTLRFLSPFKAVDYLHIVKGSAIDLRYIWPLVIVGIAGALFAYFRYKKRDVRTVA